MIDEHTSFMVPRAEVRTAIDKHLDEVGREMAAVLTGRDPVEAQRETWGDDPTNEQGIKAMAAIAAQYGG